MVRAMGKQFWLMKSEPDQFGIADLARVELEPWTGVRSYFARAHMRAMSVDDAVLFHHSNATPPGVAGLARVVRTSVVDETQFDPDSKYYDPKATRDKPIWDCVEVEYVATLPHFVAMDRMRAEPALSDMLLLKGMGMRLSVQPVAEAEYEAVVALGHTAPPPPPPKPVKAPKARNAPKSAKAPRPAKPAKAPMPARRAKPKAAKSPKAAKVAMGTKQAKGRPPGKPSSPAKSSAVRASASVRRSSGR
jgi:predicted RNA-binding protein with PUA-like domain